MPASLPDFRVPSWKGFWVPYWKVEAALARMHDIAPEDVPALRSRFGAMQRAGLLGSINQPGKGRKLQYTPDLLHRAMLAFELAQAGIAPGIIVPLVNDYWDSRLRAIFDKAEDAVMHPVVGNMNDVVLVLAGIALITEGTNSVPNINWTTVSRIPERIDLALGGDGLPARVLLVNLSGQLRKFHDALSHFHLLPDRSALAVAKGGKHTGRTAGRRRRK
jgi:hypothetical protein